jgi:hypothetical protein
MLLQAVTSGMLKRAAACGFWMQATATKTTTAAKANKAAFLLPQIEKSQHASRVTKRAIGHSQPSRHFRLDSRRFPLLSSAPVLPQKRRQRMGSSVEQLEGNQDDRARGGNPALESGAKATASVSAPTSARLIERLAAVFGTPADLAAELGCTESHASRLLRGHAGLGPENCLQVARLLRVERATVLRAFGHGRLAELLDLPKEPTPVYRNPPLHDALDELPEDDLQAIGRIIRILVAANRRGGAR